MGENTLYLDFPGNEVKPIFGWDQVYFTKFNLFYRQKIEKKGNSLMSLKSGEST